MTSERLSNISRQIQVYRDAILNAKEIEKDLSWISQYNNRLVNLENIISFFYNNEFTQLEELLESEGRSYGWSFYPGEHGERTEKEFWKLRSMLTDSH